MARLQPRSAMQPAFTLVLLCIWFERSNTLTTAQNSWPIKLGRPELVLDTHGIVENTTGLKRIPQRPQKMGQVIKAEHPWETGIYFYGSVVQTDTEIRLYYGCAGPANPNTTFFCVAISADGVTFTKPLDLGLVAYNGSTSNNIVWATPYSNPSCGQDKPPCGGHQGTGWSNSVLFDDRPDVPSAQRFKLTFDTDTGVYGDRHVLIAVSSDGFKFQQLHMTTTPHGALVTQSNFGDTNTAILWIERLDKYMLFGRRDGLTPGASCPSGDSYGNFRQVAVILGPNTSSSSSPFENLMFDVPPTMALQNNRTFDPGCVDYYNPAPVDNSGVTFIFPSATRHLASPGKNGSSFPSPYDSCRTKNDGFLDIRMAFSRLNEKSTVFERLSTQPTVARGIGTRNPLTGIYDQGVSEWDAGMVFMATGLVQVASEPTCMSSFYFGSQFTHGFEAYHLGEMYSQTPRGYGRLRWRQEGFVALSTNFHDVDDVIPSVKSNFNKNLNRNTNSNSNGSDDDDGEGTLVTRVVVLAMPPPTQEIRIALNVATSVSGTVGVQILDGVSGLVLPGFESLPIVGNELRATVVFNATLNRNYSCSSENGPSAMPRDGSVVINADITDAIKTTGERGIRLRISMFDAQLFSITFVSANTTQHHSPLDPL
eukprot:m.10205 g.10205  ORF g.10205 m.10205 type:complete len:652 (+) comp8181_c0_seq1:20-1975(+)